MKLKYNALLLAVISAIQLTGCGGGGSNNSAPTPNVETRPTPTIESTTLAPLTIKTIKKNQCNSAPISADVVFHDGSGAFVSSFKTNSSGQLDTGIPENARHASFILKTTDNQNVLHTQIQTVLNIQNGFEVDALVFNDPNTCGCSDIIYNLETLSAQIPNTHLHNAVAPHVNLGNGQVEVYACVPEQQRLLYTHSVAGYKGGLFDTSEPSTLMLSDEQFTATGTPLDLSIFSFEPNYYINLTSYVNNEAVYNVTVNETEIDQPFEQSHDRLVTFSDLATVNYLSTSKSDERYTGNGYIKTHSYALSRLDNQGNSVQVQHFDSTQSFDNVLDFFIQTVTDESDNIVLDLKSAHDRLDALIFSSTWSDVNHGNSSWHVFSDGQDIIPDLSFGHIIPRESLSLNDVSVEILLLDLNTDQNFDDMRELYFESAESFQKSLDSKLFDGMASYSFATYE
ncbi:hypothetical protein [Pseudoalteromonas luteoviolacea]|uniref:Uncharacterized protein n=1 Tax=Pseudoalteromonas luteoviolacea S4054 TaxID=1129367 RepID=A0A0F6AHQ5_9GAMM|nr:hypothetical protein [Pseudoalteromonas luteoviolacea]AOT11038.1 hypothetical protein S4054249_24700 [Pseudoalteromonas luteoviolacea]AOT15798.1 hypothetical protein S40542_23810 [Pseudoalteromonas luteoviolacea]AOT20859.1 hypothetical protein S4054_24620 [Pseudoalteromonas luteoviolacea]KKE85765.1 hypothetical protein N479_24735 [Pseudoalteromonas luteoviolacea S4054]KZN71124.1 hypothetical protein N481_19790 [Pseudoalteromonas luteoviolacea S4047-1]